MKLRINIVDAFTDKPFKGNAAAVIITKEWLNDELMQAIALENNLSETAFVISHSASSFTIRWFSPLTEIDFCGHATLAAAKMIFINNKALTDITFFAQAVGELTIKKMADGAIEMCFPNRAPKPINNIPDNLALGLSIQPSTVLLSEQAYFVIYEQEQDVKDVKQKSEYLKKLAPYDVVVTAKANNQPYDFISRYFWPANGGDEDPVTGSIHAGLAPYWAKELNKSQLVAYQASARGGTLYCRLTTNKVYISGYAVLYLSGEITI